MKECKHEWYVFSMTRQDKSLLVECRKCKRFGFIEKFTEQEWKDAITALPESYLWKDNSRVVVWPGEDASIKPK